MPQIIPARPGQAVKQLAGAANGVRAQASQQQLDYATSTGQVALRSGVLFQFPGPSGSPTNYSSGYGIEVLQAGSGSAPVVRAGVLTWVSPSGGTRTVTGLAYFDSNGLLRLVFGEVTSGGSTTYGGQAFGPSGNAVGFIPYFTAGGSYAGEINF